MARIKYLLLIIIFSAVTVLSQSQTSEDTPLKNATLQECIDYAFSHAPSLQQSILNEKIASKQIATKLSDWFPQLNFNFNLQHNYKLQTSIIGGNPITFGVINTSSGQFSVNQTIFSNDVLLAASTAGEVHRQAAQTTTEKKIDLVVNVSKAFYAVLMAQDQINLVNQDIKRLIQSQQDTYHQYKGGVVDTTDYLRATIALNNAKTEQKQDEEMLKTSYAALKQQLGYPPSYNITLSYDKTKMENDIFIDTTQTMNYSNRIEYQLLQTDKNLQEANLDYYEWSFLPTLSAFGEYNLNFMNNNLPPLYNRDYPTAYVGLQLSLPIFQGGKRIQEVEEAKLQVESYNYDISSLKSALNTDYVQSLANYKSSLSNYNSQKENLDLAKEVYNTIELQYKSGIITYLDVITAETDLRTTEVNYINALYQVLSSKLDLEKALGTIRY
jgi:outer membrane protein